MTRGIFKGRPKAAVARERRDLLLAHEPSAREVFEMRTAERLAAQDEGVEQ